MRIASSVATPAQHDKIFAFHAKKPAFLKHGKPDAKIVANAQSVLEGYVGNKQRVEVEKDDPGCPGKALSHQER